MGDATIAFGALSAISWFLFVLFGILSFEIHLQFQKYKSALTAIQRFGVVLSLEQVNEIYFNNELKNEDVLEILGSSGHQDVDMNGHAIKPVNSPWSMEKIDGYGNLKDYKVSEGLFSGAPSTA